MKILDWYILKRYLSTFFVMVIAFVPIGIMVDLAEKNQKMKGVPISEILVYYLNFVIYFANVLFPIFLFLSVIWVTSILANRTEIIAMLGSGISYNRFLRPYFYGATFLAVVGFGMGMFLVPYSSRKYNEFYDKYLRTNKTFNFEKYHQYNQINKNQVIYVSHYDGKKKVGSNFTMETFKGIELKEKITADEIQWIENDSVKMFRLHNYVRRFIGERDDVLVKHSVKDTLLPFEIEDLLPVDYAAETKNLFELDEFIAKERLRGSSNIRLYEIVRYKRWSFIVTSYILTFIGVAAASVKRRGGMGVSLSFGILIGFSYVFFDRIFSILSDKSGLPPLLAVAIPNILFFILALYLLRKARQ